MNYLLLHTLRAVAVQNVLLEMRCERVYLYSYVLCVRQKWLQHSPQTEAQKSTLSPTIYSPRAWLCAQISPSQDHRISTYSTWTGVQGGMQWTSPSFKGTFSNPNYSGMVYNAVDTSCKILYLFHSSEICYRYLSRPEQIFNNNILFFWYNYERTRFQHTRHTMYKIYDY